MKDEMQLVQSYIGTVASKLNSLHFWRNSTILHFQKSSVNSPLIKREFPISENFLIAFYFVFPTFLPSFNVFISI